MYIIHSLIKTAWEEAEKQGIYGEYSLNKFGFIHCSEIDTYEYVAPNFKDLNEEMVLLVIDTDKVKPEIKWEDLRNCGVLYPHIYGLLDLDAVVDVLPHLWTNDKTWIVNDELKEYQKKNE